MEKLFYLISLFVLLLSCSDNYENNVMTFNSYEDLQAYIERKVQEIDTTIYVFNPVPSEDLNLRSFHPQSVKGYHACQPYDACSNLELIISSFQDAQKLGIVAYKNIILQFIELNIRLLLNLIGW